MAFKQPTRADDETLLHWLQLRDEGYSTGQIAAHYGTTPTRVRAATTAGGNTSAGFSEVAA